VIEMARGPSTFKQRDITRALKAAVAARVAVRVEIDKDGNLAVVMTAPAEREAQPARSGEIVL
jgi:hypothetical protein